MPINDAAGAAAVRETTIVDAARAWLDAEAAADPATAAALESGAQRDTDAAVGAWAVSWEGCVSDLRRSPAVSVPPSAFSAAALGLAATVVSRSASLLRSESRIEALLPPAETSPAPSLAAPPPAPPAPPAPPPPRPSDALRARLLAWLLARRAGRARLRRAGEEASARAYAALRERHTTASALLGRRVFGTRPWQQTTIVMARPAGPGRLHFLSLFFHT